MKYFSRQLFCLIILAGVTISCTIDNKEANERAVESLNKQLKAEEFELIYNQSSNLAKSSVSKNEFIERMKAAVALMKESDENLNWKKSENEDEFYRDYSVEDTSIRTLDNQSENSTVWIYWSDNFTLCGFEVVNSKREVKVVQNCS
jgi:hypothetical protein